MNIKHRLLAIAAILTLVLMFLLSMRLFLGLLILHMGYGTVVLLPGWIIDRTSIRFQILYSLSGGPLLLAVLIFGIWRLRYWLSATRS